MDKKVEGSAAQKQPSLEEAALLEVLRTADALGRAAQRLIKRWKITATQYNVLRILRGAQATGGATCSEIGERMITAEPDITRLLARLKKLGYIGQQRDKADRRIVRTQIRPKGLELLSEMDAPMKELPKTLLSRLDHGELHELMRMLQLAREGAPRNP